MLYVERSPGGKIIGLHSNATPNAQEKLSVMDEEVIEFFSETDSWKNLMALTDRGTIRILEDLIDLLVKKNIINFTELPQQAQARIWERKQIRERIVAESVLVDDII